MWSMDKTLFKMEELPAGVIWRCHVNKVFWKIEQNSQENICAGDFVKKWLQPGAFPGNFVKIFRTSIL